MVWHEPCCRLSVCQAAPPPPPPLLPCGCRWVFKEDDHGFVAPLF
jgi:hypothetical protein